MKKQIILMLLVICSCILFPVLAFADADINYDSDTLYLSVSGKFENSAGKAVTLQVIKPHKTEADVFAASMDDLKNVFANIKETKCDASGIYSFTPFKISGDSGYYSLRICVTGSNPQYFEKAFLYISPTFESDTLEKFCNPDISEDELADYLCDGSEILQIEEFAAYNEEERAEIIRLCTRKANNINEIKNKIDCAIVTYTIKNSENSSDITDVLSKYSDSLKAHCLAYPVFETMDKDGKKEVSERLYSDKDFESADEMLAKLGDTLIFSSINTMDNYMQLEAVLEIAEQWFGSDYSCYFDLKSKKTAALKIIGKNYDDKKELEEAVKKAVDSLKKDSDKSGGGSSSSTSSSTISVPVSVPSTPDVSDPKPPLAEADNSFSDMNDALWANEAVNYLCDKGIINGMDDSRFAPNQLVTREQFAKMLVEAFAKVDLESISNFSDCPVKHWSSPYISSAFKFGFVKGISDSEFGLGRNITRQDMAVMLCRAAEYAGYKFERFSNISFADESIISDYALDSIKTLSEAGIINGMNDNNFAPFESATRAQAAKMIYEVIVKGG